jgi:predicted Zn-dependent protease
MEFPEGWDIVNGAEQVVATEPGTQHHMLFDLVRDTGNARSLADIAQRSMSSAGFRSTGQGGSARINGLDAWVGTFEGELQDVGPATARLAVIEYERNVYRLIGFAPRASFGRIQDVVVRSQQSFRGLSREEARDIRPNIIDLYTVRQGDTWQSIAQRVGGDNVRPATLAIMNGFQPAEQPRPGDRIKIVVAG